MTLREELDARLAEYDSRRASAEERRAQVKRRQGVQDQLQQQPQAQHHEQVEAAGKQPRWLRRRRGTAR